MKRIADPERPVHRIMLSPRLEVRASTAEFPQKIGE